MIYKAAVISTMVLFSSTLTYANQDKVHHQHDHSTTQQPTQDSKATQKDKTENKLKK